MTGTSDSPVVVVTGSSRGLGRGVAEQFLTAGGQEIGCSRGPAAIDSGRYEHFQLDLGDERQVRDWLRSVRRSYGRVDALVANAALIPAPRHQILTAGDTLEQVLRTNVTGVYYACREAARVMATQRSGRIVVISSAAIALHDEGTSAYAASKAAVVEMTKILAKELAPAGVTCNVIAPGMVRTQAAKDALGTGVIDDAISRQTIKRYVTVDDIWNAISFFCSPASSCVTAQVLYLGVVA